jgi:hydroxymethylbilane synthase
VGHIIRVGTRGSRLALTQTEMVAIALRRQAPDADVQTLVISSKGDQQPDAPLASLGVGVFTKALEDALLDGRIDIAVHSLKDLPTEPSPGLAVLPVMQREDPHDVLINRWRSPLADLPAGARIGTSSPRREAQLRAARPDLVFLAIRGNVEARLSKAMGGDESGYDGTVLAAAGLARLGLNANIAEVLPPDVCTPSPGQGALAVETRDVDVELLSLLSGIVHQPTKAAVEAERWVLRATGGGCAVPLGTYAIVEDDTLQLWATVSSTDGVTVHRTQLEWPAADPEGAGKEALRRLLEMGAGALMGVEGAS